ncbi:MAG TPA: hypothetical protein VHG53_07685 [Candidatus Limnocylindria bacterium]|nr:hypothetical protein [Candidatus Limnocylindria bacterium]
MEKPTVLKASSPGGHRVIRGLWFGAFWLLVADAALYAARSPLAPGAALVAAAGFSGGIVAYAVRYRLFLRVIESGEQALVAGDVARARSLIAPVMDRYPAFPPVQELAGRILYASGDPLSAAALLERSLRWRRQPEAAVALVASYAALNKVADARRAAALLPDHPDVRLALAWSELVALGGDRERGAWLASTLPADTPARAAMTATLRAVAAAYRDDAATVRTLLSEADERHAQLAVDERAFLGYLGGVALRELGALDDARATFTLAMDGAPETIGEALARRERSHLASGSDSWSDQPSAD